MRNSDLSGAKMAILLSNSGCRIRCLSIRYRLQSNVFFLITSCVVCAQDKLVLERCQESGAVKLFGICLRRVWWAHVLKASNISVWITRSSSSGQSDTCPVSWRSANQILWHRWNLMVGLSASLLTTDGSWSSACFGMPVHLMNRTVHCVIFQDQPYFSRFVLKVSSCNYSWTKHLA